MDTPVLIPAHNEALNLERTLNTLSKQSSEIDPYVIVNGCTDNTADIARNIGAKVLESEHGKMRAIQEGIRFLGASALDSLIILDADTRPFSKRWSGRLAKELERLPAGKPSMVWGPVAFLDDINPFIGGAISAYTTSVSWADRNDVDPRTIRGGNSALKLNSIDAIDEVLHLDNYWPREDVALFDTVMQNQGSSKTIFHYEAWANTSGDKYSPMRWLKQRVFDHRNPNKISDQEYESRTPADARPYNSPFTRHSNKNPDLER